MHALNALVKKWELPSPGWVKLNVDGSFVEASGEAGVGMILRDADGQVIFLSCQVLFHYSDALEAELVACLEGLSLTRQWSALPISLETDCSTAASLVRTTTPDRSRYVYLIAEVRRLIEDGGDVKVTHVRRHQNYVARELARIGCEECRTTVWLRSGPDSILELVRAEGAPISE